MCILAQTKTGKEVMHDLAEEFKKVVMADRKNRGFLPGFALDGNLKSQLNRGVEMVRQGRPVSEVVALAQETMFLLRTKQVSFFHQEKEAILHSFAGRIADLWKRKIDNVLLDPIRLRLKALDGYCYNEAVTLDQIMPQYWGFVDMLDEALIKQAARDAEARETKRAAAIERERQADAKRRANQEREARELEQELAGLLTA